MATQATSKFAFLICVTLCLAPLVPLPTELAAAVAPAALILGTILALTLGNPYSAQTKPLQKTLLQAAVVALGFSMDINKVIQAGSSGIIFSLASITAVFLIGHLVTKVLKIRPITGLLVSTGTAICGGSAIAAISSVVDAPEEDISVAIGTIFILNGIALILFPILGHALGLTQHQFGIWAGIAIHDVASVAGAGTAYGPEALDTATAVKLSRVLFLIPITAIVAYFHYKYSDKSEKTKIQIPWFIGLFILASLARTAFPPIAEFAPIIKQIASTGFALSLFFIGTALSKKALKSVGVRPLILGIILWIFISVAAFLAVKAT
ncbi:MAG: YeiH family protein [Fimbriimonadaceae bacterium]